MRKFIPGIGCILLLVPSVSAQVPVMEPPPVYSPSSPVPPLAPYKNPQWLDQQRLNRLRQQLRYQRYRVAPPQLPTLNQLPSRGNVYGNGRYRSQYDSPYLEDPEGHQETWAEVVWASTRAQAETQCVNIATRSSDRDATVKLSGVEQVSKRANRAGKYPFRCYLTSYERS